MTDSNDEPEVSFTFPIHVTPMAFPCQMAEFTNAKPMPPPAPMTREQARQLDEEMAELARARAYEFEARLGERAKYLRPLESSMAKTAEKGNS